MVCLLNLLNMLNKEERERCSLQPLCTAEERRRRDTPPFVQRPLVASVMTPSLCLPPLLVVTVPLAASTGLVARSTPPAGKASDRGQPRR